MTLSATKTPTPPAHVADPALAPFLQPRFDPADFLNATLPALSTISPPAKSGAASLADLSTQTQDLLSQLNAHATRLSNILTQLTDDILRSGGRLAYEVDVLRGETTGLAEALADGLDSDIHKFLPGGIKQEAVSATQEAGHEAIATSHDTHLPEQPKLPSLPDTEEDTTPDYISDLRTLTTVRARLETVIKVFGEAMHWSIPPSELSLGATFISVSAPEAGTDSASREQKGKEFAASLRSEIADLITGDTEKGPEMANARIQALKDLATVWKGTAEEKVRVKFVDSLVKLADEKQRELDKEMEKGRSKEKGQQQPGSEPKATEPPPAPKIGGFLENLQRIRGFVESEFE